MLVPLASVQQVRQAEATCLHSPAGEHEAACLHPVRLAVPVWQRAVAVEVKELLLYRRLHRVLFCVRVSMYKEMQLMLRQQTPCADFEQLPIWSINPLEEQCESCARRQVT